MTDNENDVELNAYPDHVVEHLKKIMAEDPPSEHAKAVRDALEDRFELGGRMLKKIEQMTKVLHQYHTEYPQTKNPLYVLEGYVHLMRGKDSYDRLIAPIHPESTNDHINELVERCQQEHIEWFKTVKEDIQ